jgi:hypothetical protein
MPLQEAVFGAKTYIKSTRVSTSNQAEVPPVGSYFYSVQLPQAIQNVVGVELSEWTLPQALAPPFLYSNTFQIILHGPSLADETFTVQLGANYFVYNYPTAPANSYVDMVAQVLNDAVQSSAVYGPKVSFSVAVMANEFTSISLETIPYLGWSGPGSITFDLIFTTIPESPAKFMGFEVLDYLSNSQLNGSSVLVQNITSNSPVDLSPFRYVNVTLGEVPEARPLAQIYLKNERFSTVRNVGYTPVRFLTNPIKTLSTLTVDVRLENGNRPTSFAEHDFTFIVYSLSNEIQVMPQYGEHFFNLSQEWQYLEL